MSTDLEFAWAAGLFDGEGCVFIARQVRKNRPSLSYSLRLSMSMVHKPTLERFASIVGFGSVVEHRSGGGKARESWQWATYNSRAVDVLRRLRPFLVTKAIEADLGVRYAEIPKTYFPKGGRTSEIKTLLESLRIDLKAAKRYEWKHDAISA